MDGTDCALLLGVATLTCWMGAGLSAVLLNTDHKLQSAGRARASEQVSIGLTAAGGLSAVAMVVTLVWP